MKRFCILLFCISSAFAAEIHFDLNNPIYSKGSLSTEEGGIITGENFRIQAKKITYISTKDPLIKTISASDDLMVQYESRTFIGKMFFYDFVNKKGFLLDGKTSDGLWYVGGSRLDFLPDKSVVTKNAFATTSEDQDALWDFHAKKITLDKDMNMCAKSITFRSAKTPVMYLPYFSTNINNKNDSPIRYSAIWETGQGPKLSVRYRVWETQTFALFTRLDYRIARGGGGAIETDYKSLDKKSKIRTKSYLAHDTFVQDPNPNIYRTRYRLQGIGDMNKVQERMNIHFQYDYISDQYMPGDFRTDDFELSTALRTELKIDRTDPWVATNFYFRPRINSFQGFKQELPTVNLRTKPFELFGSGIVFENDWKIAYLDYDYSEKMQLPLNQPPLSTFRSGRFQTSQNLYRNIDLHFLTLTPNAGYSGIYYTNNPTSEATGFSIYKLGVDAKSSLYKNFPNFAHVATPYTNYTYIATSNQLSNHFVFSIDDGFDTLHQVKVGFLNEFYSGLSNKFHPVASFDFYTYGFFGTKNPLNTFPDLYFESGIFAPRMSLLSKIRFNYHLGNLVECNTTWKWTISNRLAFSAELRNRSQYYIRKSDPTSYIVDVTRPLNQVINTPLSDRRNTFLIKARANLTPFTYCQVESHFGWGRSDQPSYTESKFDFFTMITTNWKLRLTYMHTVADDSVGFGISMIPYKKS